MLKDSDNPPMLPTGVASVAAIAGHWWLGHVKSRAEKKLANILNARGIGYFLPMVEYSLESGGKMRHPLRVLFPSYVFFCGSENDRYLAVSSGRLCQAIDIPDQAQLKTELDAVWCALRANLVSGSCPLPPDGNRFRITSGPLTGAEGISTGTADTQPQLILPVSVLGQGVVVTVAADSVTPAAP